jgi:hypothetical protein
VKLLHDGESEALRTRIAEKLDDIGGSSALSMSGSNGAVTDFVEYRFVAPLEANAWGGPAYGRAFTAISVATIAAGLFSSSIAAVFDRPSAAAIAILGLAVGVLTAINQLWKPAQRSGARYQAAYALRREGWDFVNGRGRYAQLDEDRQLGLFVD